MGFFNIFFGTKSDNTAYRVVSQDTMRKISEEWANVEILLKGKSPSQLRQALIVADKCLDAALKDIVPGETMGERLKNAISRFDRSAYGRIWDAHKLRNSLVHEAGFEPPYFMINEAVANLKEGLYKLGVRI